MLIHATDIKNICHCKMFLKPKRWILPDISEFLKSSVGYSPVADSTQCDHLTITHDLIAFTLQLISEKQNLAMSLPRIFSRINCLCTVKRKICGVK